jgi:sugar-specific transcriptional regulator TrmB
MQPWLYIVILGACIIGYAYMRPRDVESKRTAVVNDIEIALDQFAEELEEGNKELMISVTGLKRDLEAEINKLNGRLSVLEKQNSSSNNASDTRTENFNVTALHQTTERAIEKPKSRRLIHEHNERVEEAIESLDREEEKPADKPHENDIKNRYGAIFELHAQGKSIEYISKKTGMNKGEIQLIIQLARQEEQFRA